MGIWIYDLEVYRNLFMATFLNKDSDERKVFLIYSCKEKAMKDYLAKHPGDSTNFFAKDKQGKLLPSCNDYHGFVSFCNRNKSPDFWLVGYNNHKYDNIMSNFLILNYWNFKDKTAKEICYEVYKLSVETITRQDDNGGGYNKYMYADYFNSMDLMRVAGVHKYKPEKNIYPKGLKAMAVNLKWHKIQDLPIPFDQDVNPDSVVPMAGYNYNDCAITKAVYLGNPDRKTSGKYVPKRKFVSGIVEEIRLRAAITKQYDVNVMNEDRSGMSNKLFEQLYSKRSGLHPSAFKNGRTERSIVMFKDAIFTDKVHFNSPELKKWLAYLLEQGVVCNTGKITIDVPSFWYGGLEYQFGAGGLHSVDKGAVFKSDKLNIIKDADVGSFYPRIIINYGIKPYHLSNVFIDIMRDLADERLVDKATAKKHKKAGNKELELVFSTASEAKKIQVNAAFGKLGSPYSFLYDPLAMIQVTINGQLFLMMLAERFNEAGFKVISANTDGLTAIVPRDREQEYDAICEGWQKETGFLLEFANYTRYIRRDVNNYLVVKEREIDSETGEIEEFDYDNHIKVKGDFDPYLYENLEKGFDKPVVPLAVYNYFVNDIPIQETIRNHDDIYDYCMSRKNGNSYDNEFSYVLDGEVKTDKLQKSNRLYITTGNNGGVGGKLIKAKDKVIERNGMTGIKRQKAQQVANEYVSILNDYVEKPMSEYNIKYMYYIIEAQKLINSAVPPQTSLFL